MSIQDELKAALDLLASHETGAYGNGAAKAITFVIQRHEEILSALAIAKLYEDAATGECVEAGSLDLYDSDGGAVFFTGYLINADRDEIKGAPPLVYRRVRIIAEPNNPDG